MDIQKEYASWLENAPEYREELLCMDEAAKKDAFYRELEFGTGGLRGKLGAGLNRMNLYTVAKVSQGVAKYVLKAYPNNLKIAVAYDSRLMSSEFAHLAGNIFSSYGLQVMIFSELAPTPMLSFAVRYYRCTAGIVITASHNPAQYNGYKVYGPDGCQITTIAAEAISGEISKSSLFNKDALIPKAELIQTIGEDCISAYIQAAKARSMLFGEAVNKDISIVYTPLNGTGLKPVTRILRESGFTNIHLVEEQAVPDGHFPTCPYPNPEIREALELGLQKAEAIHGDLLLATDPDADRVGIAVRDGKQMRLLTGNEVGLLLLDFIARQRISHSAMPLNPVFVKTIVTTSMAELIADDYHINTVNVLTGFKYIGEQIGLLEQKGEENRYLFGFEESYGYLAGSFVRDKDSVSTALLICEMHALYRSRGESLIQRLNELYRRYGYYLNTLHSYTFEGPEGYSHMQSIMHRLRESMSSIGNRKIAQKVDFLSGIGSLPKADVLSFALEDGSSVIVRPSGTEPKIKLYYSVRSANEADARQAESKLAADMETYLN